MNDVSRNKKWNSLLRFAGFVAALAGMYISARFSVNGFQFSTDNPKWIGWAIAGIIIVLESVWQKFGKNRTLFAIAVVCYGYGIITNVVGIAQAKGGYASMDFLDYVVAIVFGTLFEVFPEPLLAWSISGDVSSDPLGKLIDGIDETPVARPINQPKKHINTNPYRPAIPSKPNKPMFKPLPIAHREAKPYPRQSPYINAARRMDEDNDLGAMG